MDCKIFIKGH